MSKYSVKKGKFVKHDRNRKVSLKLPRFYYSFNSSPFLIFFGQMRRETESRIVIASFYFPCFDKMSGILRSINFLSKSYKYLPLKNAKLTPINSTLLNKYAPLLESVRHTSFFNKGENFYLLHTIR